MSFARFIEPGQLHFLHRRCLSRQLLLRPDELTCQVLRYCLAEAATRFDIELHAFCFLSNHYHLILTDPWANLPRFMAHFNRHVAKCINVHRDRQECLWSPGSYNDVQLPREDVLDAVVRKTVYTLANPVSAGLVSSAKEWPGVWSDPDDWGVPQTVPRPGIFFRNDGCMPDEAILRLSPPRGFLEEDLSQTQWDALIRRLLTEREEALEEEFQKRGRRFLGRERVLQQSPLATPSTPEPKKKPGEFRPRAAASSNPILKAMLGVLDAFSLAYRAALQAYCKGDKETVFPAGTYKMRVLFGVTCAPSPAPS